MLINTYIRIKESFFEYYDVISFSWGMIKSSRMIDLTTPEIITS